jgi:hypothetical protein
MDETLAEVEAIAQELEAAGLIVIHTADDGSVSYTLTRRGVQVKRSVALGGDAGVICTYCCRRRQWMTTRPTCGAWVSGCAGPVAGMEEPAAPGDCPLRRHAAAYLAASRPNVGGL